MGRPSLQASFAIKIVSLFGLSLSIAASAPANASSSQKVETRVLFYENTSKVENPLFPSAWLAHAAVLVQPSGQFLFKTCAQPAPENLSDPKNVLEFLKEACEDSSAPIKQMGGNTLSLRFQTPDKLDLLVFSGSLLAASENLGPLTWSISFAYQLDLRNDQSFSATRNDFFAGVDKNDLGKSLPPTLQTSKQDFVKKGEAVVPYRALTGATIRPTE